MIQSEKCIVVDVDGTLCPIKGSGESYANLQPYPEMKDALVTYKERGFYIILMTSRNMRTFDGDIGRILANTAPVLLDWLKKHEIPYDEIHFGKPWPGHGGFYVDDRAIRPREFLSLSYDQIQEVLNDGKIDSGKIDTAA
jgi:capsule biosynthesis phosphatase